jgi:hypothetical protein
VWSATVDTDDTANRIAALGDSRIRFLNLPFRSAYPEGPTDRWLVSGVMPYDRAVELCRGGVGASLDDDDEFLPGHIEVLLELALERRAEFVYMSFRYGPWPDATIFLSVPGLFRTD